LSLGHNNGCVARNESTWIKHNEKRSQWFTLAWRNVLSYG
jgi:hypothetical protein